MLESLDCLTDAGIAMISNSARREHRGRFGREPAKVENDPYFGWLQTRVPTYGNTLNIKTVAREEAVGVIPSIEVIEEGHPLTIDQQNGISFETAIKKVEAILWNLHEAANWLLYPQLVFHIHCIGILLLDGDGFADVFVDLFAFFGEEGREKIECLIAGDGGDFFAPILPAQTAVELVEIVGETELQKFGVGQVQRLPVQAIGREIVDLARILAESAAVDRKETADGIVGNQIELRGTAGAGNLTCIPVGEGTGKPGTTRAEYPDPSIIHHNAAGTVDDRTHGRTGSDLGFVEGCAGLRGVTGKDFDLVLRGRNPLLHKGPARVLGFYELFDRAHPLGL